MRRLLTLFLSVPLLFMQLGVAQAEQACPALDTSEFRGVHSKTGMEKAIATIITRASVGGRGVDWECLLGEFDSLGDDFSATYHEGGGFAGGDVLRFTYDRSNAITPFVSVPGASNMVYTAVINVSTDGSVAIVRRGGRLESLEAPD